MTQMLYLKCPKCKNNMKYQAQKPPLQGKVKCCVYCGYSFKILGNILK